MQRFPKGHSVAGCGFRAGLLLVAVVATTSPSFAQSASDSPVLAPANQRFVQANTDESPDFQRHVVPLLGKLGCNGRACHGSFQGRGDFRLSLFGYDFAADHQALLADSPNVHRPRADRNDPAHSLILQKPTETVSHEGGLRFEVDSWEYNLLRGWIDAGARPPQVSELVRLDVEPREILFTTEQETVPLRVVAEWTDGVREDVTCLCRFQSNQDAIAEVTPDGLARAVGRGDTHLIVFYDNGVQSVPVVFPQANPSFQPLDENHVTHPIDRFVARKLNRLRIEPSEICTDAEFLRRVSIDLTGSLPTPDEVLAFLADDNPHKRTAKIDELLERPTYASYWANRLCDYTGCDPRAMAELGQENAVQWYQWIYRRVADNVPYDEIVAGIMLAEGRLANESYANYTQRVSSYYRDESPGDYADQPWLTHFWSRETIEEPQEKALSVAHAFLGIRLQCAQCHKHPWDRWTTDDFHGFAKFFEDVTYGVPEEDLAGYRQQARQVGLQLRGDSPAPVRGEVLVRAREGGTIPFRELYLGVKDDPVERDLLQSGSVNVPAGADPRHSVVDWMRRDDNPYLARAFVNRVWAGYFYTGIIDPTDDLNAANPPSHPELLAWLAGEFVASGHDMKWLHRQIASSDTYQRSFRPNATNRDDARNYSRAIPRRIPAEVLYDGLKQVLAADGELAAMQADVTRRASGHLSTRMAGTYAMRVFGKPDRTGNCDCERVNRPSLLQSIFMQNDPLVHQRLQESGFLASIRTSEQNGTLSELAALVESAWLRALGRRPSSEELSHALEHLRQCESAASGMEDLLWALVNTKEFLLNH